MEALFSLLAVTLSFLKKPYNMLLTIAITLLALGAATKVWLENTDRLFSPPTISPPTSTLPPKAALTATLIPSRTLTPTLTPTATRIIPSNTPISSIPPCPTDLKKKDEPRKYLPCGYKTDASDISFGVLAQFIKFEERYKRAIMEANRDANGYFPSISTDISLLLPGSIDYRKIDYPECLVIIGVQTNFNKRPCIYSVRGRTKVTDIALKIYTDSSKAIFILKANERDDAGNMRFKEDDTSRIDTIYFEDGEKIVVPNITP